MTKEQDLTHEQIERLNEARIFIMASSAILPILEKRREQTITKLILAHREGKTETTTIVAELSVIDALKREILQKQSTYETLEIKHDRK